MTNRDLIARREAPCRHFGVCSGCELMDKCHEAQLDDKRKYLAKLLDVQSDTIIVHGGRELGYRNRMEFIFSSNGAGLRMKNSPNEIIVLDSCPICDSRINSLLSDLNQKFNDVDAFSYKDKSGTYRYAVIRAAHTKTSVSFVLNNHSPGCNEALQRIKEYAADCSADNVLVTYTTPSEDEQSSGDFIVVKGEAELEARLMDKVFRFSSQGFFQNNTEMAEKMQEYVHGILLEYDEKSRKGASLIDLYGGVGTFGIINSGLFGNIHIVESFPGCIRSADDNIRLNNALDKASNVKAYCLDAHQIGRLKLSKELFVITDPPRSGMTEKALESMKRLKPKVIVYISCNAMELAKDVKKLKSYKLKSLALFDLFPQTRHMEAIAELIRE